MEMRSLLRNYKTSIALVIGNGINLYGSTRQSNSWHALLLKLAKTHLPAKLRSVPAGVSLTEFYDVLELKSTLRTTGPKLQREFCELMTSWQYYAHHQRIVDWAQRSDRPILTTNFEQTLSDAGNCILRRTKKEGFTDYYPWENFYGTRDLDNPNDGFGIWHVNGMQYYHRSVRLGLSHYMGSVERARGWLHKGNERRLFSGKNEREWDGAASWLHIVFNSPLLIFGMSLEENEVFFRWLLIERARYFKKFPDRRRDAWYVYAGTPNSDGKQFFLEGVGVVPQHVSAYDEIYGASTWT